MRHGIRVLAALAVAGCCWCGVGMRPAATTQPADSQASFRPAAVKPFSVDSPDVVLLVTGGTNGRLEICDCLGPQPGGLTRRSGLAASYRAAFGRVLLIDTGDVFWFEPADTINRYVLLGYQAVGYDLVTLGDHEWKALGGPLEDAMRAFPCTYLSSNASAEATEALTASQAVFRIGQARLAVISYLGPDALRYVPGEVRGRIRLEGLDALQRRADALKALGYAVILVAHVDASELPELEGLRSVDLVIRAHTAQWEPQVAKLGSTPCVKIGGADYVGALALKLGAGRIEAMDFRLEVLDDYWPVDTRLMEVFKAYIQEDVRRQREQKQAAVSRPAG